MKQIQSVITGLALLFSLACCTFSNSSNAQGANIYLGLGLSNMTYTFGDDQGALHFFPRKPNVSVGISNEIPLAPYVFLEPGLFFSDKGYNIEVGSKGNFATHYFVSLPIMAKGKYQITKDFAGSISFGPFLGYGLGGKTSGFEPKISYGTDINQHDFRPFDYGLTYGLGFQFKHFIFGIMKERGYANLYPDTGNYRIYNTRMLRVYLGFNLGKKKEQTDKTTTSS